MWDIKIIPCINGGRRVSGIFNHATTRPAPLRYKPIHFIETDRVVDGVHRILQVIGTAQAGIGLNS